MEEPDVGEPPTVDPVATASIDNVEKYLKNVSICTFEENNPCSAIDKVRNSMTKLGTYDESLFIIFRG